jgi:DNA-directed RNA polymerase specialized sigma24 family protein
LCLMLVTVEGLSYEEAANQLSISLGATKSLIHRARKTLNEKLGKEVL